MTDDWLQREQVGFAELDEAVYRERLRAHVIADSASERPFCLFDPSGQWIAGNQLNVASEPCDERSAGSPVRFRGDPGRAASWTIAAWSTETRRAICCSSRRIPAEQFGFDAVLLHALLLVGGVVTGLLGLGRRSHRGRRCSAPHRRSDHMRRSASWKAICRSGCRRSAGNGDLDRLIRVINGMLDDIERLMQEVKGVCDSIAHDLRTPLTRLLAGS